MNLLILIRISEFCYIDWENRKYDNDLTGY